MNTGKFSIVIPNWNGKHLLRKNLPQVLNAVGDAEIVIIDDASTDNSVDFIKKNYSQVKLVIHKKNKGFAASCNHGVNLAKGEIVVLLNTDVIPQKGFLQPIFEDFSDSKVFAVGCGEASSGPGWAVFKKGMVELVKKKRQPKKCFAFWASGGQSAFSRQRWLELGGFDTLYRPFYWEDVDLCYRAWKRGFKIVWDPRSKVVHAHEGVISKSFQKEKISFIGERNQLLFIWKNIANLKMMLQHKIWLFWRLRQPFYWRVFFGALAKTPQLILKRLKEIKEAKVSDRMIFGTFKD